MLKKLDNTSVEQFVTNNCHSKFAKLTFLCSLETTFTISEFDKFNLLYLVKILKSTGGYKNIMLTKGNMIHYIISKVIKVLGGAQNWKLKGYYYYFIFIFLFLHYYIFIYFILFIIYYAIFQLFIIIFIYYYYYYLLFIFFINFLH